MFARSIVSSLGRQIVSMAPSYVRIASGDATAGARDALRLHVLGASPDPHHRRATDGRAVHTAIGDRWARPARNARAHARCRIQLASALTASTGAGVAQ